MELLLVRHAIASENAPSGQDEARALTEDGRRRFRQAIRGLRCLDFHFSHLLHSPWLRAVQSAEMLVPLLRGRSEVCGELAAHPEEALLARLAGVEAELRRASGRSAKDGEGGPGGVGKPARPLTIACVGHQPYLGELLGLLTTGDPDDGGRIDWRKGGVAWLVGEPLPGGCELRALLPPGVLKRLR